MGLLKILELSTSALTQDSQPQLEVTQRTEIQIPAKETLGDRLTVAHRWQGSSYTFFLSVRFIIVFLFSFVLWTRGRDERSGRFYDGWRYIDPR